MTDTRDRTGGNRFPEDFQYSPFEQLQDVLQWTHNRRVREEFTDLAGVDEQWTVDLNTPRARLRVASTIREDDSADMILMRMWLFYVILGKAKDFQTPVYGIPIAGYQEARKFRPQINLFFKEDVQDVEEGYRPVTGEISFRLQESNDTLTQADLERYATRIRANFAAAGGFVWKKGRTLASYTDWPRGYQLQLLVRTDSEAKRVIEQVLDIQGHSPNWEKLNISENDQPAARYPIVPPTDRILGRTRRLPRQRPIADVRFRSAHAHVWGMPNAITLIDLSGFHRNPLVRVQ